MQPTTRTEEISTLDARAQPEMTEREAIARAQRGDAAGFEHLYRAHNRRVFALCLRVVGNPADAEELTQDAFLCVFRKIHTFRGESAFSTWLHRLATNIVLMRLRKKTVSTKSLEESAGGEESDQRGMELGAPDPTLTGSIDRVLLDRAIAQLSPGYKRVFVLHDVLGYEHNEIATMSGHSIGNSKSQLHKARVRMRSLLRKATRGNRRDRGMQFRVEFV
jgi:RNA polymerase sigma-70 factor (ECF subfamily)